MIRKNITLNRPVFTQQAFDSSGLTVLTSLFYRFAAAGSFDMIVRRNHTVILRCNVQVETGKTGPAQTTLDLAALDVPETGLRLDAGSVLCFFVSKGTDRYSVSITHLGEREKTTLLDSARTIPEGGLFAVTLTHPGTYLVRASEGRAAGRIHVRMPAEAQTARGEKYRTEHAEVVEISEKGQFKPDAVNIYAGQSVVFLCRAPARIQVALEERAEDSDPKPPPFDRKPERRDKTRYRRKEGG